MRRQGEGRPLTDMNGDLPKSMQSRFTSLCLSMTKLCKQTSCKTH